MNMWRRTWKVCTSKSLKISEFVKHLSNTKYYHLFVLVFWIVSTGRFTGGFDQQWLGVLPISVWQSHFFAWICGRIKGSLDCSLVNNITIVKIIYLNFFTCWQCLFPWQVLDYGEMFVKCPELLSNKGTTKYVDFITNLLWTNVCGCTFCSRWTQSKNNTSWNVKKYHLAIRYLQKRPLTFYLGAYVPRDPKFWHTDPNFPGSLNLHSVLLVKWLS